MSFWSNLTIKLPAILSGVSGLSAYSASLFPAQAPTLTAVSALSGVVGATLHSFNPAQTDAPAKTEIVSNLAPMVIDNLSDQDKKRVDEAVKLVEQLSKILANQG